MGDSPSVLTKRCARADRDIATSCASRATVHWRIGYACNSLSAGSGQRIEQRREPWIAVQISADEPGPPAATTQRDIRYCIR